MKRAPGVRLTDGYSHSAFFYLLQLHPSPGQDRPRRYLMQVCCKRRHITYADVSLMCRRAYLYVSLMCRFVQLMCRLRILHCGLYVPPVSVCLNYISAVFLLKTPAGLQNRSAARRSFAIYILLAFSLAKQLKNNFESVHYKSRDFELRARHEPGR